MKFCPFISDSTQYRDCSEDCALFADNKQCAIKNLGNADSKTTFDTIHKDIDALSDQVCRIATHCSNNERLR